MLYNRERAPGVNFRIYLSYLLLRTLPRTYIILSTPSSFTFFHVHIYISIKCFVCPDAIEIDFFKLICCYSFVITYTFTQYFKLYL